MGGLSIITAIHNALPMNQVFWEALSANTTSPFELIIVDNHSTDGSEIFFKGLSESTGKVNQRVVYVRNNFNQGYSRSQMQGMSYASLDMWVFLNNDTWMPKGWHIPIERELTRDPRLVVCPSGQETQPTQRRSDRLKRRWKRVSAMSRVWRAVLRRTEVERIWKSLQWMYGSLDSFHLPTPWMKPGYFNGIKGDCLAFHRDFLKVLPNPWDENIEAADWHLYLSVASLNEKSPDIPLPRVLLDSYIHHFGRYSARLRQEPARDTSSFRTIQDVWGDATVRRLWWGYRLPKS